MLLVMETKLRVHEWQFIALPAILTVFIPKELWGHTISHHFLINALVIRIFTRVFRN